MVALRQDDNTLILRFGGGVHSHATEDEIDVREASRGQNFLLGMEHQDESTDLTNREPFDLLGTAPNGGAVRGFINLLKSTGRNLMAVQAGDTVYQWDGTTFTSIGTVNSAARLRGRQEHNFQLDDKVIITDLAMVEAVRQWDGTDFEIMPTNLTSTFRAKYCVVENERANFANVESNALRTPHIFVGSKRGDPSVLSVNDRPSSSLGADDPFFIPMPDLRSINGLEQAYGKTVFSTEQGSIFELIGSDARDFEIVSLYPRSGASGEESLRYVGNDIVYGKAGRIESLVRTEKFGDVQSDDLSLAISDLIEDFDRWTVVYDQRMQRVYFLSENRSDLWVLFKNAAQSRTSPWSLWRTDHASAFQPTAIMNMIDPGDGLEYVYFGDSTGGVYRMPGAGKQDGGNASVKTEWVSKMTAAPADADVQDIEGWINYRTDEAATVTISFEFSGYEVYDSSIQVDLPAIANRPVFRGGLYFRDGNYFNTKFKKRLRRQPIPIAGAGSAFQVKVSSSDAIQITEIGLVFNVAA